MTLWYRTGTASVANGSPSVVGVLTTWGNQVLPGDAMSFDAGAKWYEVLSVEDNTHLTLNSNFGETTVSGGAYSVQRVSPQWSLASELSTRVAALLDAQQAILDADVVAAGSDGFVQFASAGELASDSGFFWDNTTKKLVLGGSGAALSVNGLSGRAQLYGTDNASAALTIGLFDATAAHFPRLQFYRSKNAAVGSATVVAADDSLGAIDWIAAQQTGTFSNQNPAARIAAEVDGTVSSGAGADMPGRLIFLTTADSSGTLTERMRIDSSGNVGIGVLGAAARLHIKSSSNAVEFRAEGATHTAKIKTDGAGAIFGTITSGYLLLTTNDNERARFDSAGNFVVGLGADGVATFNAGALTPRLQLHGTDAGTSTLASARHSADASGANIYLAKSRHASAGSHTIVQINDAFGTVNFAGSNGASFITAAAIRGESDGTPGASNDMPGRIVFLTVADGSGTLTERMRIDSSGRVGIGLTPAGTAWLEIVAGTTSKAALALAAGTNLTSAVAGAVEFDGVQLYNTLDTSSGRGAVPVEQYVHLTADGSTISTIANFFGATSNISLVANAYYYIEIFCWFLNTTSGTVTWTLTNSAAPTSQNIHFTMSPVAGIVAPPGTATQLEGAYSIDATAAKAFTTGTLTTAVDHYAFFRIWLKNGTGTSLKIQATKNVGGTITPRLNSYWVARRLSPNNIGTLAA